MKKIRFVLKQFPFIFPKYVIQSAHKFIDDHNRKAELYKSKRLQWYLDIVKEEFNSYSLPRTIEKDYKNCFLNNISYKTYSCSLFYLQNTFVFGNEGFILTNFHSVFQEFTHFFNIKSIRKHIYTSPFMFFTTSYHKMDGAAAILLSPQSHNFYHWFSDVLPRIRLYEPVMQEIDYFCISEEVPSNFLTILPFFGIHETKILRIGRNDKIQFKHLYLSSLPGSEGRSGRWSIEYVRNKLIGTIQSDPKVKYYIKRGNAKQRHILNESEVISFLENEGFEILDTGSISINEQIKKMRKASMVISMHGAALTNLLFTSEGCKVIEIHTTDYFRTDCYYTLASICKLPYWYIVAEKAKNGRWGDVILSIEKLKKTIEASANY